MGPEVQAVVDAAVQRFSAHTDGPENARGIAARFAAAIEAAPAGEAALEIGVRSGGTSAMMCFIAERLLERPFAVLSVDPYGRMPYLENHRDVSAVLDYGEQHYARTRQLLAGFQSSIFFRLDVEPFLLHLLPHLAWWFEHRRYPTEERFLSFAFLDGPHDDRGVALQCALLLPRMAPGASLVIDNSDKCPGASALLPRLAPGLQIDWMPPARLVAKLPLSLKS